MLKETFRNSGLFGKLLQLFFISFFFGIAGIGLVSVIFGATTNIYDQKIAICSFASDREMFAVIIESREVAETQRQIFEMAWRYAGKR